jgi:hypothetical protein
MEDYCSCKAPQVCHSGMCSICKKVATDDPPRTSSDPSSDLPGFLATHAYHQHEHLRDRDPLDLGFNWVWFCVPLGIAILFACLFVLSPSGDANHPCIEQKQ